MRVEIVLPISTIFYSLEHKNADPQWDQLEEEQKVFVLERRELIVVNGRRVEVHEFFSDPSRETSVESYRNYISAQTFKRLKSRLQSCKY